MANKSNFDSQMDRMRFLMEYKSPAANETKNNSIEYTAVGADGKAYGIIKEGNTYYIKYAEKGKEHLTESYSYIGGFNYRNENGYKSYNEATKQLELKLSSLNEAYGKKGNVSTVDFDHSKKAFANLTEAARAELNRMHAIMENSEVIGKNNVGDPESKGSASDPAKQGDPFTQSASASLDKDPKFNGTVEGATPDNKKVGDQNRELQSDKMKRGTDSVARGMKDAHDDLEGEGVADKRVSGAKAVKMNESCNELDDPYSDKLDDDEFEVDVDNDEEDLVGDGEISDEDIEDALADIEDDNENYDYPVDPEDEEGDQIFECDNLEQMLNEFMDDTEEPIEECEIMGYNKKKETIVGPDSVLDGPHDSVKKTISNEGGANPQKENSGTVALDGPHGGDSADAKWERINENIDTIVESVCNKLICKNGKCKCGDKESMEEAIQRIIKEEVTRLNAWGKHPRYQKPAFRTPENREVLAGTAEKDWNNDSTKGQQPYGRKIGNGAPFDKIVDILTDSIVNELKEGKQSKKA